MKNIWKSKVKEKDRSAKKLDQEKVKKTTTKKSFEEKKNLDKLYVYIVIANQGQADTICSLLQYLGSSAQYIQHARGTAPDRVKDILNIVDNTKEVIFSFINEKFLDQVQLELNAYFAANKKNSGLGFAIPLTSIMGVKAYKFLSQTL